MNHEFHFTFINLEDQYKSALELGYQFLPSSEYMNNDLFYLKGLEVTYNKYNDAAHKQYLMGSQFVLGLSAFNANCSFKPEDLNKRLY